MDNLSFTHYKFDNLEDFKINLSDKNFAITVGNFEIFHNENIPIIENMIKICKEKNLQPLVISCNSSDLSDLLTTDEEKVFRLKQLGVENFISCEFKIPPSIFEFSDYVEKFFGTDYVFKEDNNSYLEQIKTYFKNCDFYTIKKHCGSSFPIIGIIERGKGLGRTVGMPTANLGINSRKLKPPSGVYATTCYLNGEKYAGLTNIGKRPTVDDDEKITIETFIIDFDREIYGETMVLMVDFYIRGVQKFGSLAEVKNQVSKDIEVAKEFYKTHE